VSPRRQDPGQFPGQAPAWFVFPASMMTGFLLVVLMLLAMVMTSCVGEPSAPEMAGGVVVYEGGEPAVPLPSPSPVQLCKSWLGGEVPAGGERVTFEVPGWTTVRALWQCDAVQLPGPGTIRERVPAGTELVEVWLVPRDPALPQQVLRGQNPVTVDPATIGSVYFKNRAAPTPVIPRDPWIPPVGLHVAGPIQVTADPDGICRSTVTLTAINGGVIVDRVEMAATTTREISHIGLTLLEGQQVTREVHAPVGPVRANVAAWFYWAPSATGRPSRANPSTFWCDPAGGAQ